MINRLDELTRGTWRFAPCTLSPINKNNPQARNGSYILEVPYLHLKHVCCHHLPRGCAGSINLDV